MKVPRLYTFWSAEEAWMVIDLLDRLRDALWEEYGEQVIEMHWQDIERENDKQLELDLDGDESPF